MFVVWNVLFNVYEDKVEALKKGDFKSLVINLIVNLRSSWRIYILLIYDIEMSIV